MTPPSPPSARVSSWTASAASCTGAGECRTVPGVEMRSSYSTRTEASTASIALPPASRIRPPSSRARCSAARVAASRSEIIRSRSSTPAPRCTCRTQRERSRACAELVIARANKRNPNRSLWRRCGPPGLDCLKRKCADEAGTLNPHCISREKSWRFHGDAASQIFGSRIARGAWWTGLQSNFSLYSFVFKWFSLWSSDLALTAALTANHQRTMYIFQI